MPPGNDHGQVDGGRVQIAYSVLPIKASYYLSEDNGLCRQKSGPGPIAKDFYVWIDGAKVTTPRDDQ